METPLNRNSLRIEAKKNKKIKKKRKQYKYINK